MKHSALLIPMIAVMAGFAPAAGIDTGYEPEGLGDLKKQKGVFSTVLVRPDTDFSRFSKIHPQTVELVIRDPASANQFTTGRLNTKREKASVIPEYREVVEFKRIVGEAIVAELGASGDLEVVDTPGPGTLILRPIVTAAEISSSSKNTDESGRELPELKEGTIVFDLTDGGTGEILARFAEKKRNRPPKNEKVSTGLWPNLPYWAGAAAADLREELRLVQQGSPRG